MNLKHDNDEIAGLDERSLTTITELALAEKARVQNPLWQEALLNLAAAADYLKLLRCRATEQ